MWETSIEGENHAFYYHWLFAAVDTSTLICVDTGSNVYV